MRKTLPFLAVVLLSAAGARAQLDPRIQQAVEQGIDRLVTGAGDRYKLDETQKEKLRDLLNERTKDFMSKNEATLKEIMDGALALREKGRNATLDDITKLIEKGRPLMEAGRKHMEETADTVRDKILNDDQRKMFNEDRARGQEVFDRFSRGGGFGGLGGPGGPGGRRNFTGAGFQEQEWDSWLGRTGRAAKMTDEQTAKAKELLDLAKKAAAEYRKAKEADYKKIAADLAALRTAPDAEKRKVADKAAEELGKPIDDIGKKWKADVISLLTDEQKKAAESAAPKR